MSRCGKQSPALLGLLIFISSAPCCFAYSLLTHEQLVDIAWKDQIQPLLQARFQTASTQELSKAHAYAYGGCLIQDIGYYPFGNKFFSDLTHYVRSGDFVVNLIRESADLNEFAFALGALSHYASDISAHPSINRAVALSFPKLRAKYGDAVTYAQNPKAHIRVEFGFDLVQIAKNRYASDRYHDFIGFQIPKALLERAMLKTYGLDLKSTLGPSDLAIGTFRRAVSQVIPKMVQVTLMTRRAELVKEDRNFSKRKFLYNLSRSEYEKDWGRDYRRPGLGARILAFFLKLIPKIGPVKVLDFKIPSSDTEELYIKSVNRTVDKYRDLLHEIQSAQFELSNLDFDTANPPRAGEYVLSDQTFARLIDELGKNGLDHVPPDLRADILAFYSHGPPPLRTRRARKQWCKTVDGLWKLNSATTRGSPK